jgi:GAF domain-containing protein/anti-sigma regulatory factor (Ser/Thr protein kinase)
MNQSNALLRQQESLREIIESISSELELRPLLTLIVRRACDLLGADNGTIGLVDEQRNVVRTEAAYNMPIDEIGSEAPPGVGLFGNILLQGQPLILGQYANVAHPIQRELLDNAVIGVPIIWRDRVIGAFGLGSPPPRQFDEQDVEVLSLFARHAAIAIVNAQLFAAQGRRMERSAIINQISRQITRSLDLPRILQTAVKAIESHLHYSNVALLLIDPEEPKTLVLRARSGPYIAPTDYRQSIFEGIIGAAVQSRQSILVPDVRTDARYLAVPGLEETQAELALPLIVNNRVIGVLNIESKAPINADAVTDLEIISDQLSVAIDNARRYEEEKRRTQRLELIARVGQRIAARLDPDELFTVTIQELYTHLGYDHVAFFLLDQANPVWLEQRAFASRWPDAGRIGYRQSIERGLVGAAARQRTPVLVNDVSTDTRFVPVSEYADLRAEVTVPILLGERLLGVFDIASRKPFAEDDIRAIQIVADQLAVAIEHTYLFADTQRTLAETELLYQTTQRISVALDVNDVVQTYLEQVAAQGRYACNIALYEYDERGEPNAIVVLGRWTPAEGIQCPLAWRESHTRDALDPILEAGQTVAISNVHTDPRASDELRRAQEQDRRPAIALIPLMVRGQRIGLVILTYPAVYEWQASHLHPYQITATQLATAIDSRQQQALAARHNAQLAVMEERRRLARELHDSVTQLLFSITLIAQSVGSAWRRNPMEGEQRIGRLLELSQAALAEMRALLVELRPPEDAPVPAPALPPSLVQLRRQGLAAALHAYIHHIGRDGLQIDLNVAEYARQATEHEETLFRIAQESLNNVMKHARATRVVIHLDTGPQTSRLTIRDNGVGFEPGSGQPQAGSRRGGLGLHTMRERAVAVGGELTIHSAPGEGTTVEVRLPVR